MFPNLFSIGPVTLHTYGLFVAMGFLCALMVTMKLGRSEGIGPQQVMDMGFLLIVAALVGSRLLYVFMNFSYYLENPLAVLKVWEGGLVFSGGILGVLCAVFYLVKKTGLSFWQIGDLWAPGVALGQGIGRIGCFMAGCCYGRPVEGGFGVVFTHLESLAPRNIALYPTQIYASLLGVAIFVALYLLHKKKAFQGQVCLWFLILHSTARLFEERFRGDDRGMLWGTDVTVTQGVALALLAGGITMLLIRKYRQERR